MSEPPVNTDRLAAFDEVRCDQEKLGATFAASNDEQAVLDFARATEPIEVLPEYYIRHLQMANVAPYSRFLK